MLEELVARVDQVEKRISVHALRRRENNHLELVLVHDLLQEVPAPPHHRSDLDARYPFCA